MERNSMEPKNLNRERNVNNVVKMPSIRSRIQFRI